MKLLLHACCADCAIKFLESTKKEKFEVTIFYYNPNIHPRAEYTARLKAMQQVAKERKVKIVIPDWRPREYFEKIRSEEMRKRCIDCWDLRLEKTAHYAKMNGFEYFSSTLVTSEYQDQEKIEKIAKSKAAKIGIKFWKAKEIDKNIKTSGFYKQFFCGCVFSLGERYREKYQVK